MNLKMERVHRSLRLVSRETRRKPQMSWILRTRSWHEEFIKLYLKIIPAVQVILQFGLRTEKHK